MCGREIAQGRGREEEGEGDVCGREIGQGRGREEEEEEGEGDVCWDGLDVNLRQCGLARGTLMFVNKIGVPPPPLTLSLSH